MKIQPLAKPGALMPQDLGSNSQAAEAAKARAIAKLTATQAPVPVNPNSVSAEEIGAIQPQVPTPNLEAQEETQTEAPKAPEPTKPVEEPASSQMAILARKERALRAKAQQQDQALKAREQALQAREDALNAKDQDYQSNYVSKSRLKQETLAALAEAEVSYDEITQQILNQQSTNPATEAKISRLEATINKLTSRLEQSDQSQKDQQSQAYRAAVRQIETDVKHLVNTDPSFEAIKATRSVSDVVELIEETYKKDGILLSVEEAANEVENYLIEEATKLTKLEKIKKRLSQPASTTERPQSQTPVNPKQPQTMKTLTNATSSTRQLSAKERAILAFKGELGKG